LNWGELKDKEAELRVNKGGVMTRLNVTFINESDGRSLDVEIDSSMRSVQLIRGPIAEQFALPLENIQSYMLITEQGRIIEEDQTLAEAGVDVNDRVRVSVSQRSAGIWPELLTIVASIASVAQVVLMVIDMWSRKAKERSTSKARVDEKTAWNEVKSIRILMSDGNWVQFDSWLTDPNKLKSFLEVAQLPSNSPRPLLVWFLLENGSRVQLAISSDPIQSQQIEDFINILRL
jgi:hypothetical protein